MFKHFQNATHLLISDRQKSPQWYLLPLSINVFVLKSLSIRYKDIEVIVVLVLVFVLVKNWKIVSYYKFIFKMGAEKQI